MSIKVAIDSAPLSDGHSIRGIGVMVREQIEALKLYGNKAINLDTFDFNSEKGNNKIEKGNYDAIHYPHFFPYALTLPSVKPAKKVVVTIQDLIHLIYPKNYPPGVRGKINFYKQKQRLKYVDAIITISETSKKDIVRFLGIPAEKIFVTYLVPSKIFKVEKDKKRLAQISKKYNLPDKFVFNLGDINYNKNIPTLIDACEMAKVPLVLGGKQALEIEDMSLLNLMDISGPQDWLRFLFDIPHPEHAHYEKLLVKFKNNKNIFRLGYVPDEDVSDVMNLASVYCQPSYYEGFGLSVIHAFACGTPVVITKTNALVEIAGGASLIADPNDINDMAEKITKMLKDNKTQKELIDKGFERLKDFSSEKMANEMIKVYEGVVGSK